MKLLLIMMMAFIVSASQPRATARFCFNAVVRNDAIPKAAKHADSLGCYPLTVTRIDDDYSHVYGVRVYVGEGK